MATTARQQWNEFRKIVKKHGRKYGGKYIAMVDKKIVGVGKDQYRLYKEAIKGIPPTKPIGIYYIPTKKDFMVLLWNILT